MLGVLLLVLGPVSTNCYLVADTESGDAVVIDPAWDGRKILAEAEQRGWRIGQLWYTHAHFDHIGGAAELTRALKPTPSIALHAADFPLWQAGGGAALFGYSLDTGPAPDVDLAQTSSLRVGAYHFEVRHAPGHSAGMCLFYCAEADILFSGDLIFCGSVGRSDLPGGDWEALERSIRSQVYSLPDETRILPGHGEETSVGEEKRHNPFVEP